MLSTMNCTRLGWNVRVLRCCRDKLLWRLKMVETDLGKAMNVLSDRTTNGFLLM